MTNNFIEFDGADPAVASLLGNGSRRRQEAALPKEDRQKKIQARRKAKNRLPGRVNWDLPLVKQAVVELAGEHGISASQVATLLLLHAIQDLEAGRLDLESRKIPSGSPKYEWNLDFSDFEA